MKQTIIDWLLNGIQEGLNFSELVDLGIVSEEITNTEDCKIITRTFTSHDDTMTKIVTVYVPKKTKNEVIKEYDTKIAEAVAEQRYEDAARLRDERNKLQQ